MQLPRSFKARREVDDDDKGDHGEPDREAARRDEGRVQGHLDELGVEFLLLALFPPAPQRAVFADRIDPGVLVELHEAELQKGDRHHGHRDAEPDGRAAEVDLRKIKAVHDQGDEDREEDHEHGQKRHARHPQRRQELQHDRLRAAFERFKINGLFDAAL